MKVSKTVQEMIGRIDRRQLRNNTQRVLLSMLCSEEEWVSRRSLRVPSVGSRLRDLRKEEFGGFDLRCATPSELERPVNSRTRGNTFYRLSPRSITVERISKVFGEGVVSGR